ncbi:MAG: DUF535 family protein [Proteobacteria bacterium]|nr:DUF535 family protein [Pseudomonadota bacterium]
MRPDNGCGTPLSRVLTIARATTLGDGLRFGLAERSDTAIRDHWIPFLDGFVAENGLPPPGADLLLKPVNQYVILDLPPRTRVRLLSEHYRLMAKFATPGVLRAVWENGVFDAGTFEGRTNRYRLSFCGTAVHQTRKEGEMTIVLGEDGGEPLAKLTLILNANESGRQGVMIGGVQGPRNAAAKEIVVSATRDMYGLRPRDAVLLAAGAIGAAIGARESWGVSGDLHVHHARSRRHQKKFHADYDAFWAERGAERAWPFGWILAVPAASGNSGRTANGRRRDALKHMIWCLTQAAFTGAEDARKAANESGEALRCA